MPGTGWPEPGGLLPREALGLVRLVAEGGISGMEVVECSPPYDWAEQTSLISARVILDALATMVSSGRLGKKASTQRADAWGPTRPELDLGPTPQAGRGRNGSRPGRDCGGRSPAPQRPGAARD